METNEVTETMIQKDWSAEQNMFGLWVVGPVTDHGTLNVLGMGRTFREAFDMAYYSVKEKS